MIFNIQALRALGATLIIICHLYPVISIAGHHAFGGQGVDLFFVISGFIMVGATRTSHPTPFLFMANRATRIVPAYWAMTLVVFGVAAIFPNMLKSTTTDITDLLKSMFFIPFAKLSNVVQPVLFIGWTLNYEMFFYLLFSVSLAVRNYRVGLILLIVALGAIVMWGQLANSTNVIEKFYTDPMILEFALGVVLGMVMNAIPSEVSARLKYFVILTLFSSLALLFLLPILYPELSRLLSAGGPSTVAVGCAVALETWGVRVRSAFILSSGDASYIMYLLHPFFTLPLANFFQRHEENVMVIDLSVAACFIIIFTAGHLIHFRVEKPVVRYVRSVIYGSKPARVL